MKRNSDYRLVYLAGTPYLVPYGQMLAGHRRSLKLNESGAAVWELLKTPLELPELVKALTLSWQVSSGEEEAFRENIQMFVEQLKGLGMIQDTVPVPEHPAVYLKIAGLTLALCVPEDAVSENFDGFFLSREEFLQNSAGEDQSIQDSAGADPFLPGGAGIDQLIRLSEGTPPAAKDGFYLLQDPQLCVYEMREHYLLSFPAFAQIKASFLSKDGSMAVFYRGQAGEVGTSCRVLCACRHAVCVRGSCRRKDSCVCRQHGSPRVFSLRRAAGGIVPCNPRYVSVSCGAKADVRHPFCVCLLP